MSINNVKNSRKWFLTAVMSLLFCVGAIAQSQVSGTVVDQTGEPVIGAYVTLDGDNSVGTITDFDGYYEISVPSDAKLIFSFMGYESQTLSVAGKSTLDVTLSEETTKLDEVVAIGYGSQKAKEVTSSVTSVKSEDFNAGVKGNPMGLLQGKVAGLNISKKGGDPTSTGYNIQIRGFSTLDKGAGSAPLYIVDGVPVSNIDNISPEEIASMDVLKDGSAAAIYGTRGTNGVIIITTKRSNGEAAECGVSSVEYSGYVSYAAAHKNTGMATPEEYRNLEAISGGKVKPVIVDGGYNTDWMSALLNPAPITHSHNVAISGNTKNFGYRGSVMFKDAKGVAINSGRQEIIAKIAADQKLLQGWLKLQYDFSYMHYRNDYFQGDFKQAAILNPTYSIYSSETESGYYLPTASGQSNPVAAAKQKESYQEGNYFRGSVKATVDIKAVKGLKVNAFAALEEGDNYNYYYCSQLFDTDKDASGVASRETSRSFSQLYEATIDYSGSWKGHNLAAVAGFSYQNFFYDGSNMSNKGFPTDNYKYYSMYDGDASKSSLNVGSWRNSNTLMSLFARVNYNYNEKYLISASIRREGSSRFGENNKWGWFPAVSAGWRISGEDFMSDQTWCDDLKLRAGFGITGNNLGSDLKSKQLLSTGGTFWYNGQWITTYGASQNANPDLRWEKKYEYNVGIDFAFLKNRLSGTIDLYYRDTKDLLWEYDVPTPPYQFNKLLANCGEIVSKGIEISLTGVPVLTKDWNWTTNFTIAFNDNKIKKLSDPSLGLNYSEMLCGGVGENGIQGVNTQKIVEGQSVGTFYGYKWVAINTNGNLVYEKEADGKTNKLQVIGNAQPLFTYGWNNTVRWKNLDLTLFFRGVYGNDVLNVKRWAYGPNRSQGMNVFIKDVEAIANGTGVYRQGRFSDYYLEDGSYLKLDNITLGYNVPLKPNKYVQSLRVYATAENVFTITSYSGIDPEVNTSDVWKSGLDESGFYPSVTNIMLGVNVVF